MKELGDISYFLGISVQSTSNGFFLSQHKYAADLLAKSGMINCKPCATPVSVKPPLSLDDSLLCTQPFLYRSIVGALQYLTITRPELSFVVNQAWKHMHSPTMGHFAAVKRILCYVKGTFTYGLHYF